jgi:nucleotide-binding universal stress UspA family protein
VVRETGATLNLLHVLSLAPLEQLRRLVAGIPVELEQRLLDAAQEELRKLAAILLQHHGISADVRVVSGALLSELASQADAMPADLIILGARGVGFMRHLLLGSTAERMITRTLHPMLVVKQASHQRYRTLLVPVDFSPSSLPALRNARDIAPNAKIVLLHAFEVPFEGMLRFAGVGDDVIQHYRVAAEQEALQKLRELCDEAGLSQSAAKLMVLHGDPSRHMQLHFRIHPVVDQMGAVSRVARGRG